MYSWPKQKNIENKIYNSYKFEDDVEYIDNFNTIKLYFFKYSR